MHHTGMTLVSTQQNLYTPQQREIIIINFIKGNQGCTKADITIGLKGIISKKTIDKIVDQLIGDNIVHKKEGSRNHKLYLNEDNLLVSVPLELEEFEAGFDRLLFYVAQNLQDIHSNKFKDKSREELLNRHDTNFTSLLQCINILDKISNVYMTYSVIEWPKKMKSEEDLKKLFSFTFNKLADIRLKLSKIFKEAFSEAYSPLGNMPSLRKTYATDLLEESVERFNKANLQNESEPLISSIWKIHKEIEWWTFPEPRLYKWDFSYDEGYKKFLSLCKQNPDQRRDNLTPEEFERIHKGSSKNNQKNNNMSAGS
jgi:hypothetical protein